MGVTWISIIRSHSGKFQILKVQRGMILSLRSQVIFRLNLIDSNLGVVDSDFQGSRGYDSDAAAVLLVAALSS